MAVISLWIEHMYYFYFLLALAGLEIVSAISYCNDNDMFSDEIIKLIKPSNRPTNSMDGRCPDIRGVGIEGLREYVRVMKNQDSVIPDWSLEALYVAPGIPEDTGYYLNKEECIPIRLEQYDYDNNINIQIPLTENVKLERRPVINSQIIPEKTYRVSTKLTGDSYDYVADVGTSTMWLEVEFDRASVEDIQCQGNVDWVHCQNALYDISSLLFNKRLTMNERSFISKEGTSFSNAVVFDLSKTSSQYLVKRNGKFGVRLLGCNIFKFEFVVEWRSRTTGKLGSKFALEKWQDAPVVNYGPQGNAIRNPEVMVASTSDTCLFRRIRITEIIPTTNMVCRVPLDMNLLKFYLKTTTPDATRGRIRTFVYAESSQVKLLYSEGYITQLFQCVESEMGKRWSDFAGNKPGMCSSCPDTKSLVIKNRNVKSTFCDLSKPENYGRECCYECLPNFMETTPANPVYPPICIRKCSVGFYFDGIGCKVCGMGKFNYDGGASSCKTCTELGRKNHYLGPGLIGCRPCGKFAQVSQGRCVPCLPLQYVPDGQDVCQGCPTARAYRLNMQDAACELCPPGTRRGSTLLGEDECATCGVHEYSRLEGSLTCEQCPVGKFYNMNRTGCDNCQALPELSEYYGLGCSNVRCKPSIAARRGNPQNQDGCVLCSTLAASPPLGTYRSLVDCSQFESCTNKPAVNAEYTGGAASFGDTTCPWECVAGFQKSGGSTCVACAAAGFDAAKHVYTSAAEGECGFSCKPGIYRDTAKQCNVPCVDLLAEVAERRLKRLTRDYNNSGSRPNYVLRVCGVTEEIASHEIPALRLGRYAYHDTLTLNPSVAVACGNSFLNVNEECDDGNSASGDGCSSQCKVEQSEDYWDCEEIGAPCKPKCGWPVESVESWGVSLYGYVFPPALCDKTTGTCQNSCEGKYYRDIVLRGAGERRRWMSENLISCSCDGNSARQLKRYEDCTPQNKGCTECPARHYFHDTRGKCVECGSHCLPGFRKEVAVQFSKCQNTTEYKYTAIFNFTETVAEIERKQALVGCIPCYVEDTEPSLKRWLANREAEGVFCNFECWKDTTGLDNSNEAYCSVASNVSSGHCPDRCLRCSDQKEVVQTYLDPESRIGKYLSGCVDVYGYFWDDCDRRVLPEHAKFTGSAQIIEDPLSCPWDCVNASFYKYNDRLCLKKLQYSEIVRQRHPCPSTSDYLKDVSPLVNSLLFVCAPCEGPTSFPLKVWESSYDVELYKRCVEVCENGVSFNNQSIVAGDAYACTECSDLECDYGFYKVECKHNADTQCVACSESGLRSHSEYVELGTCSQRCIAGYYASSAEGCVQCTRTCNLGQYVSKNCSDPDDRYDAPVCLNCNNLNANERHKAVGSCDKECVPFHVRDGGGEGCVRCEASMCGNGFLGSCLDVPNEFWNIIEKTVLECQPCSDFTVLPENAVFSRNGSCVFGCRQGYQLQSGVCRSAVVDDGGGQLPDPSSAEEVIDNFRFNIEYAVREWEHS